MTAKHPPDPAHRARRVDQVAWLVAALAVATVVALGVAFNVAGPADRWTVTGGIAGMGALAFAYVATLVAVVAYRDSAQAPVLRFEVLNWGEAQRNGDTLSWRFEMTVVNDGPVAARFLAVRITIDGAHFSDDNRAWSLSPDKRMMQYDGGADDIVHPHWREPMRTVHWQVIPASPDADTFTAKIELVADRTSTVTERQTVAVVASA